MRTRITRDDTRRAMLTQCQARLDQARAVETEIDALPRWRLLARALLRRKADAHLAASARWLECHDDVDG